VLAWGSDTDGQLGNGSTADSDIPVRVRLPGASKVTSLAAGAFFAVAGTSGGRLYSWGANNLGQLGTGSSAGISDVPVRVAISQSRAGSVHSLFAGCDHVLALFSPRLLLAWGVNKHGELGIGSITPFSNVPVKVHLPAGRKIKAVSASCSDSLALTAGGDVLAWGDNSMDQLGDDGGPDPAVAPVDVDLPLGWRASSLGAGPDARSGFALVYKVKA
jgi:alpha-tubulin suppressor-like RCC1 family protein